MNNFDTLPNAGSTRQEALSEAIRKTLSNTFIAVGAMLMLTAIAAYATLGTVIAWPAALAMFAVSIGILFAIRAYKDSPVGLALLAVFSVIMGVTMSPMLTRYLAMQNGGELIATAFGLTAAATFSCSAYAIMSRRDFSRIRAFLFAGTIVLIIAMIASFFIQIPAFHMAISAAGVLIFTAWLLHDVGSVVNGQETNYITAATGIYLDIVNMFMHLLRLLGFISSSD